MFFIFLEQSTCFTWNPVDGTWKLKNKVKHQITVHLKDSSGRRIQIQLESLMLTPSTVEMHNESKHR